MIFIGGGSLLWRAVRFAAASGHPVDLVCVGPDEAVPVEVPVLRTADVNAHAREIAARCSDGIGWSINNSSILRAPILESAVRVYNIHNGPLPAYRGLPEVAVVYALLGGETRYAATLHVVDAGIDTGAVLGSEEFEIGPEDTFQDVMMAALRSCHALFARMLPIVAAGAAVPLPTSTKVDGYFGRRELAGLTAFRDDPSFPRATALGIFAVSFPELASALTDPV